MNTLLKLCYLGCTIFFLASCSPEPIQDDIEFENLELLTAQNETAFSYEVLDVINAHRETLNLPPFTWHSQAKDQAIKHTAYMVDKNKMSHDHFLQRSAYLKNRGANNVSENVAYGYRTAEEVVAAWLASPTHKEAIESNYTATGISVIKNHNGINYYTQIFVK